MIFAILALVQEAITLEPQVAVALQSIFSKANPTPEDWAALRLEILGQSYRDYVPASALPSASEPTVLPPVTPPAQSNAPINESGASAAATDPQKADEPPVSAAAAPVQPAPAPATAYKHVITP